MALYAGSTLLFWKSPNLPRIQVASPDGTPAVQAPFVNHGPSWDFSNPEVDQLVRELRQERAAIASRGKQLDILAARLQAEQAELRSATQAVHQLQRDFDLGVARVKESEVANLKRLARVYASMEPEGASAILKQLDEVTAVKVLSFMKEDQIGAVLSAIARSGEPDTRRVAILSERLRLLQSRTDPSKAKP